MRRLDRVLKRIQSTNASECAPNQDSVDTPARDDSYADDTRAQFMRPVLRSAPHNKLTSKGIHCNGLRAFATRFSLCLSPAGNGSNFPGRANVFGPFGFDICAPQIGHFASARLAGAAGRGIVGGSLIELAVKRRAA